MVNKDRIVPVQKIDLLSLYATILSLKNEGQIAIIKSKDVAGTFEADKATYEGDTAICNQPVKTLIVENGMEYVEIYFTAAHDFEGVKIGDEVVEPDDEIVNDAATLYRFESDAGEITLTAVAPFVE